MSLVICVQPYFVGPLCHLDRDKMILNSLIDAYIQTAFIVSSLFEHCINCTRCKHDGTCWCVNTLNRLL